MRDHMMGFAPIATFIADQMPDAPKPKKTERVRLTAEQEQNRRLMDLDLSNAKLKTVSLPYPEFLHGVLFPSAGSIKEKAHETFARAINLSPELASEYLGQLRTHKHTKDTPVEFNSGTWTDEFGNVLYLIRGLVYRVVTPEGIRFSRWEGEWMGRHANPQRAATTEDRALGPVLRVSGVA